MSEQANNWMAAKALDGFKVKFMDPMEKNLEDARTIMADPKRKWSPETKKLAEAKLVRLDTEFIIINKFYNCVKKLIVQHEDITNRLVKHYDVWYIDISDQGKQPKEMMSIQAGLLQAIFQDIYDMIKDLGLDLKPPQCEE